MFKLELRRIGDRSVPKILVREGEYHHCVDQAKLWCMQLEEKNCHFDTNVVNNFTFNVLRTDNRRPYNATGLYAILRIIPIASEEN